MPITTSSQTAQYYSKAHFFVIAEICKAIASTKYSGMAFAASIGFVITAFIGTGLTQYQYLKFDPQKIIEAEGLGGLVSSLRQTCEAAQLNVRFTKKEQPWYRPIEFAKEPRFAGVGNLFIVKYLYFPEKAHYDIKEVGHCTAFYITSNIIATAAHCLKENKVSKESGHGLIFRQQYDGAQPYNKDLSDLFERVVTEWIFADEYATAPEGGGWCFESGFDYAFMRIKGKQHGDTTYTIMSPDAFVKTGANVQHTKVVMAGYPQEYAKFYEPAAVTCELAKADDSKVLNDKGVQVLMSDKYEWAKKKIGTVKDNQLFCIGDEGNMPTGGSGSPWFLDESALIGNEKEKAAMRKWVIGITSWSTKRGEKITSLADSQQYVKATAAAWLTLKSKAINMYAIIKATPAGKSFLEALTGACSLTRPTMKNKKPIK